VDGAAGRIDRLIVPGTAHPNITGAPVTPTYLHDRPGFPFDAALRDLARTVNRPVAVWTAKILEYPADDLELSGPGWPWRLTLLPLFLGVAGLTLAVGIRQLLRRRPPTVGSTAHPARDAGRDPHTRIRSAS
jgi:hypothetical protein